MSEGRRRRCAAARKAESVKFHEESGGSPRSVAEGLGVRANQSRGWRNEIPVAGAAEALAKQEAEAVEPQGLRREDRRLEREDEILKRAAAFFARSGRKVRVDRRGAGDLCRPACALSPKS
jgi:transposase